ncbi:unnamed protein product [Bemisia tabaci]|uniref:HAT C-terminal dimerisation domain-containing protein n=1 Tax=Bemisia tabaci TaxID=7038 RepID=A0A9P0FAZ5_BEMTA|nr:unnamed protein product [Bemisia tabaci]
MCPESSREDPNHPNKTREESDACPEISEENPQPSELNVTRKESKSLETETGPRVKEPSVVTHITCTEEDSFDFFKKPSLQDLDVFFGRHPFQPDDSSSKQKLPFEQSIYFSHLDGRKKKTGPVDNYRTGRICGKQALPFRGRAESVFRLDDPTANHGNFLVLLILVKMPSEIPPTALNRICELLPNVDKGRLVEELLSFARLWPNISKGPFKIDENNADMLDSHSEWVNENENERTSETEDETKNDQMGNEKFCKENKRCNARISCAIIVIYEYNMYAISFSELYKVYRFLLTIPMTQVSCERAFSQLKIIKTRLRSVMGQDNLEAFMLMVVERDILLRISDEQIIEKLCEKSTELRRLLST